SRTYPRRRARSPPARRPARPQPAISTFARLPIARASVDEPDPRGLPALSQRATKHLADHRLGQIGSKLDAGRHLVGGELLAAEDAQIVLARRLSGPQHDPRLHGFTLFVVGDTRDADLGDRRVRRDHLLDLARPHLVPARL